MRHLIDRTTATFVRPFTFPGLDETLPPGKYRLETELCAPLHHISPADWKASVLIHLLRKGDGSSVERQLTVSLQDMEDARARDRLTAEESSKIVLDGMLDDPMLRLIMNADRISESDFRVLYGSWQINAAESRSQNWRKRLHKARNQRREKAALQVAENEGWPACG